MSGRLEGQVVLVTGGGQELADAIAAAFSAEGGRIALCYQVEDEVAAHATARTTSAAWAQACDPSDPEAVRVCVREVHEALGAVDVLVCGAVCRSGGPTHALDDIAWRRVLGIELSGTLYFCREVIRPMLRKRCGRIITLTDVAGLRGEAGASDHAAARGGVAAMTRALAAELAPIGIYVNALVVGPLESELATLTTSGRDRLLRHTPLGRAARAEEVAQAALFLASPTTTSTTGHLLQVNGGLYS